MHTNHECSVPPSRMKANGADAGTKPATAPHAVLAGRIRGWLRAWLGRARSRARLRRELERLDHRLLRDMGARREDLVREAYRPFWRA